MRLEDAIGLRFGGKDALEARLGGQVVWSADQTEAPDQLFAAAQPGGWWMTQPVYRGAQRMWQDLAATIPASTPGDPVARIDDISGNANHLIQEAPAQRPIYDIVDGQGVVRTNGVDQTIYTTHSFALHRTTPFLLVVMQSLDVVNRGYSVANAVSSSTSEHNLSIARSGTDENRINFGGYNHGNFIDEYITVGRNYLSLVNRGTSDRFYRENGGVNKTLTGGSYEDAPRRVWVGGRGNSTTDPTNTGFHLDFNFTGLVFAEGVFSEDVVDEMNVWASEKVMQ